MISFRIHGSSSLKERRRAVQSVLGKLRARHSVSVADVSEDGVWNAATIGIAAVSGDTRTLRSVIDEAVRFAEAAVPGAEAVKLSTDFWTFDEI